MTTDTPADSRDWLGWINNELVDYFERAKASGGEVPTTLLTIRDDDFAQRYVMTPPPPTMEIARATIAKIVGTDRAVRFGVLMQYTIGEDEPIDVVSIVACDEWNSLATFYEHDDDPSTFSLRESERFSSKGREEMARAWSGLVGTLTPAPGTQ